MTGPSSRRLCGYCGGTFGHKEPGTVMLTLSCFEAAIVHANLAADVRENRSAHVAVLRGVVERLDVPCTSEREIVRALVIVGQAGAAAGETR